MTPGTRLGPYEVTAQIGVGGMGEVYRARDTKLDRDVAIKVLPEAVASDAERLARFDREAKTLAALNHPNIAQIHGLEESDGTKALVMELVEGPTLADRIAQGPIPVDEALPIAKQIAEALEAAHEKGIIHRDLKPANIKLRPDGTVKVLDFGLAKAMEPAAGASSSLSMSPTITTPAMTQAGLILGTAAYMSPEQARGKPVDKRADLWAFGCVLYETLAGKRAFEGEDVSLTLAEIMKSEPDMDALPGDVPAGVRRALRLCLQKDPRQRGGDIAAVRLALEGAFDAIPFATGAPSSGRSPRRLVLPVSLTAVLVALVALSVAWSLWPALDPPVVSRFTHLLEEPLRNPGRVTLALSRDGSYFVFNTLEGLFLRRMDGFEARLIEGTRANLSNPFLSPDGQWVGFFANNQLQKLSINGGTPVVVCDCGGNASGAAWNVDDTILFSLLGQGIFRVSANGGEAELILAPEPGESFDGPRPLPGGDWFLFTIAGSAGNWDQGRIVVRSLQTGEQRDVWVGGSDARYVPTGHLVFALNEDLFAVPFDLNTLEVSGGPVPIVEGVSRASVTASANYDISDDGLLVYLTGLLELQRSLAWVDRDGGEEAVGLPIGTLRYARLSPDETRIAVDIRDENRQEDVWIWDVRTGSFTPLTRDSGRDTHPVWTPDGARIVFTSSRGGERNLYWRAVDRTEEPEQLTDAPVFQSGMAMSPDGSLVVFVENDDLWVLAVNEGQAAPLFETPFREFSADVSPDGRWLAYDSDESGTREVYVRPFPNVLDNRWTISAGGGTRPLWSRNGEELFFMRTDESQATIMSVQVNDGEWPGVQATPLFEGSYFFDNSPGAMGIGRTYDVSRDGVRFLLMKDVTPNVEDVIQPRVNVVQNFFTELERLVPTP